MKLLAFVFALLAMAVAPQIAQSQPTTPAQVGVGEQGWDFLFGSWSCTNSIKSAGPAATQFTATHTGVGNAVTLHVSGDNFDSVGYLVYNTSTKTWSNPSVYADGSSTNETTTQTGPKTVWTGSYVGPTGTTVQIRDTYTVQSLTSISDLSEGMVSGAWKAQANISCTKS